MTVPGKYIPNLFRMMTALLFLIPLANAEDTPVSLTSSTDVATAGYYQLNWVNSEISQSETPAFILLEASDSNFKEILARYKTTDLATVISGKPDGTYFYKVKAVADSGENWSNVVNVDVQHHSMTKAWLFFSTGLFVFVITLFIILKGHRKHREGGNC